MKTYSISIPGFAMDVEAKDEEEALALFEFEFDMVQQNPEWGEPVIKSVGSPRKNTKL